MSKILAILIGSLIAVSTFAADGPRGNAMPAAEHTMPAAATKTAAPAKLTHKHHRHHRHHRPHHKVVSAVK
jgi:hypothetical protein